MNIVLPSISPETMKKYPLYVLVVFLAAWAGYAMNSSSTAQKQTIEILVADNKNLRQQVDYLYKANLDFKDAILLKNGIITDYKNVVKRTDSLTKKTLKRPSTALLNLKK